MDHQIKPFEIGYLPPNLGGRSAGEYRKIMGSSPGLNIDFYFCLITLD
jgi:hypothetical protein